METRGVLEIGSPEGEAGRADCCKAKLSSASLCAQFSPRTCAGLRAGQRVFIEAGPLHGLQGVVERIDDNRRIVVSVCLAASQVSVQIDSKWVKASG